MIQTLLLVLAACSPQKSTPSAPPAGPLAPRNLRLEYRVEPLGSDEPRPRFSFELDDARRGARQSAWQILVAQDPAELGRDQGKAWDSGKVESRETCQIAYAGAELQPWSHYWWKVRSYDAAGQASPWSAPAHWSTGALKPGNWKARWIGDAQPAAAFKPGGRGWCSEFADKPDVYKWVKIDLGPTVAFDSIKLYPADAEDGSHKPWMLFPRRLTIWGSDQPEFDMLAKCFKVVDQNGFDIQLPAQGPLELRATSHPHMRYVLIGINRLEADAQRGYGAAFAEIEFYDGAQLVSTGRPVWASDSREENGWSLHMLDDGVTEFGPRQGDDPLPQPRLRREFELRGPVARATLSCSALGLQEVHLNGKRVTQDVLSPGWSDYQRRVVYDTWDVTGLLAQGKNAIGVQLADGWYAGRVGLAQNFIGGPLRGIYGRKPAFLAQLEVEYADGSRETLATGPEWKSTLQGPLQSADLFDGVAWDARRESEGWDRPGFDERSWTPVELRAENPQLDAQRGTPVRVVAELQPASVKPLGANRWLFDFGRNVAGWCSLRASAPAGTELVLRHGEVLAADGSLYTENLRSAKQTDRYVFRGGAEESFEPRFTSHGFRYVEATLVGSKPGQSLAQPQLVAQVVSNSAETVGRFHTQQPVLAKLWENIGTTLRANIQSLPSDCPQRDERLGWMGDIQVFGPTALYHSDLAAFFTQWLQSVRDGSSSEGRFADFSPDPFAPRPEFVGAPGWADAGVFLPWELWRVTGDKRALELALPKAAAWLDFVDAHNPDGLWKAERGNDYGDWLNGSQIDVPGWNKEGCEVPKELFATAFFARSAELVGQMATLLGRSELAERYVSLANKVRTAFQVAYIQPDGTILGDTQAGYALALAFDLVPEHLVKLVQAKLSVSITEKRAWHMTTGMQTTQRMLLELARRGYEELASRLVRSKDFPGWGWQLDQGATSIWERWDGLYPGRGFQDPGMNSFNHFAFGSVGEYLMSCVAGIEPDVENPGYARFFVNPRAGLQIPAAGASYHSIRGTIESDWRIDGDRFLLDVTVPPNTGATVVIPALSVEAVKEGGKSVLEAAPDVLPIGYEKGLPGAEFAGRASFDVRAGKYHFEGQFRIAGNR
jgi:alpha-L-rhamnosidase